MHIVASKDFQRNAIFSVDMLEIRLRVPNCPVPVRRYSPCRMYGGRAFIDTSSWRRAALPNQVDGDIPEPDTRLAFVGEADPADALPCIEEPNSH